MYCLVNNNYRSYLFSIQTTWAKKISRRDPRRLCGFISVTSGTRNELEKFLKLDIMYNWAQTENIPLSGNEFELYHNLKMRLETSSKWFWCWQQSRSVEIFMVQVRSDYEHSTNPILRYEPIVDNKQHNMLLKANASTNLHRIHDDKWKKYFFERFVKDKVAKKIMVAKLQGLY